ncbi:hypothetical protein AB3S75_040638 [Citrus x aurantiifolia]
MPPPLCNPVAAEALFPKLINMEAEACRDMAEELFINKNIDAALYAIKTARLKNPNLPGLDNYLSSYMVHKVAVQTKSWYLVLGIKDHKAGEDEIRQSYEGLAQLFHPDECFSVAAETANLLINEAWEVLSNTKRRQANDILMGYDDYNYNNSNNRSLYKELALIGRNLC